MNKQRPKEINKEYEERVIQVDRVCRTVKGGRRMSFRALVAIGNHKGKVGIGVAKGAEVLDAVQKAVHQAKKDLITINITNDTISHESRTSFGSTNIFMKPAAKGTSILAGGSVRQIMELAGIKNVITKIIGSTNKINTARATILALQEMNSFNKTAENAK